MSQQQSGAAVGAPLVDTLSEDSIADYLRSHPDFFERHTPLVLGLKLPHRAGGAAISLVGGSRCCGGATPSSSASSRISSPSRSERHAVEKIHQLCLKLMRAPTLAARLEQLGTGCEDFAARARCCVSPARRPAPCAKVSCAAWDDDAGVRPFAACAREARCGPLRDRQKNVFDRDADEISSAALVPLGLESRLGFLIIGSRDPDHFHPGKRMDFLARLGEVLAVALRAT
jgi:uncharacterized protein YigA (DUF484 family)